MLNRGGPFSENGILDEQLYEQLYKCLYPRLYNYSFQFTRNKELAQDLVHEVFLKLWENRDDLDPVAIEALLFRMTRNMCLNLIKHLKIVRNAQIDLALISRWDELYRIEFVRNEPHVLLEKELEQKIAETLQALPDRCREVFLLSRIKGLKNRQIAEQLDISLKAVEKHIRRAIKDFRNELPAVSSIQLVILILGSFF